MTIIGLLGEGRRGENFSFLEGKERTYQFLGWRNRLVHTTGGGGSVLRSPLLDVLFTGSTARAILERRARLGYWE